MYIFHLGKHPDISIAELHSILPDITIQKMKDQVAYTEDAIIPQEIQKKLGGVMMISQVIEKFSHIPGREEVISNIMKYINSNSDTEKRIQIGCSFEQQHLKRIAFDIKKQLQKKNIRCRVITGNPDINTAHIIREKLTSPNGIHTQIIEDTHTTYLIRTCSIHNIDAYSYRDYKKPFRDMKMGMLPPKLAQIMINLAGNETKTLLDPFCGSGTVLIEGLLLGKHIDGSDWNQEYFEGCKKNIDWIQARYHFDYIPTLTLMDAKKVHQINKLYDAIVTEGYLGPTYSKDPSLEEQTKTFKELKHLYEEFFKQVVMILKNNGKIIITIPIYHQTGKNISFLPIIKKIIENLPLKLSDHNYIYSRENQIVLRNIICLEKKV